MVVGFENGRIFGVQKSIKDQLLVSHATGFFEQRGMWGWDVPFL